MAASANVSPVWRDEANCAAGTGGVGRDCKRAQAVRGVGRERCCRSEHCPSPTGLAERDAEVVRCIFILSASTILRLYHITVAEEIAAGRGRRPGSVSAGLSLSQRLPRLDMLEVVLQGIPCPLNVWFHSGLTAPPAPFGTVSRPSPIVIPFTPFVY